MPELSIITINLNNEGGLRRTIESVINQTFSDYEYIIIDGGSTDGSLDVIREFSDKIKYWISESDTGIYNAMNKGIGKASGLYLQFLNSGDWLINSAILQQIFSEKYNEDILYGNVNWVYEDGSYHLHTVIDEEDITLAYFYEQSLSHQASFFRKNLFSTQLFDENFRIVSDWKFFIDNIIIKNCSIKKIDMIVINNDMTGISSQKEYLNLHKTEKEKVISQLLPFRISKDYEKLILFSDSPLITYMPYLKKTSGFHTLIAKFIGASIKIHKIFRFLRTK